MLRGMTQATPLRADARRNRDALLAAARELFAQGGIDAPLCEVARRAGVGQGTLYRRFPTREALVAAVVDDFAADYEVLGARAGDGPEALFALFRSMAQLQRENRALIDVLSANPLPPVAHRACRDAFEAVFEGPLRDARAAGTVRTDATVEDVRLLLRMVGATGGAAGAQDAERALALALDALAP